MTTKKLIEIDGSQGEGGGQIVRTSLALSAVTQTPLRLTNIRAGRKKSGLLRQHLTCVKAAARVCHAVVQGDTLGSDELLFEPNQITAGNFEFSVGTAGSTSLVFQTVLPALMLADESSTVTLNGGTHNPWAPPFDFLLRSFLPQLAKCGPRVDADLNAYGFFPAGGGEVAYQIHPKNDLAGFDLMERGGTCEPTVRAVVSDIPRSVGQRECDTIRRKANWRADCCEVVVVDRPRGPGNVVMIELSSKYVTEVFIGFGKQGVKAEHVARGVLREARGYIASSAPVGEYLADQLLLPMGLAASQGQASRFRTVPLSQHSKTHMDVLKSFLDINISVEDQEDETVIVSLAS